MMEVNLDPWSSYYEIGRLAEQQEKVPSCYNLLTSMMRNDEEHRENIRFLEDTLRCARTGHWLGMEHCFLQYAQVEKHRLRARGNVMENNCVELYDGDPHNQREHELYQELIELLHVFFSTASEKLSRLIETHNQQRTGESHTNVCRHRDNMGMCKHMMLWLMRYYGMRKEAEEWEQMPLPRLLTERPATQGELWEATL